jgi:hypothetical protein
VLAVACGFAGIAPFAARWIPNDITRIVCGLVLAMVYFAFTLYARRSPSLRLFWELSFAFFVLATDLVLTGSIPGYVGTFLLLLRLRLGIRLPRRPLGRCWSSYWERA